MTEGTEYRADVGSATDLGGRVPLTEFAYIVARAQIAGSVPRSEIKLVVLDGHESRPLTQTEEAEFWEACEKARADLRGERL